MANTRQQQQQEQPPREMPNLMEAEQNLLGALMMQNNAYSAISAIIEPKHFYEPIHREVFDAIQTLIIRGVSANPLSVKMQMVDANRRIGDMSVSEYLARLTNSTFGAIVIIDQARGIKEAFLRRQIISLGTDLIDLGYREGDPLKLAEAMDITQAEVSQIGSDVMGKADFIGADIVDRYLKTIGATKTAGEHQDSGVPIALKELQTVISERKFQSGRIYGLLSASASGKTSLMLQLVWEALTSGNPVCLLSYDQSGEECVSQMVAQQIGVEVRVQQSGAMSDENMDRAVAVASRISQAPFQVIRCDNTRDTVARLSNYARNFIRRNFNGKTPLIVVDHIGTIKPDAGDARADEGTKARNIGQQLKSMATSLNAAVLILQQRNGAGLKRVNPRPITSDIFGGETAKQPFDCIFYLYRPEIHQQQQLDTAIDEKDQDKIRARFAQQAGKDLEGLAEIGAIKVRFGTPFIRRNVLFEAKFTRYLSIYKTVDHDQEELL